MVALAIVQAEQPLLEDRVLAVPQCEGKAQPLVIVTETGETILTPMIGTRSRLIVREIIPRIAVLAIVLANRSPLSLAEVGPPLLPGHTLLARLIKAHLFCCFVPCRLSLFRQRSPPFCIIRRYPDVVIAHFLSAALETCCNPEFGRRLPIRRVSGLQPAPTATPAALGRRDIRPVSS